MGSYLTVPDSLGSKIWNILNIENRRMPNGLISYHGKCENINITGLYLNVSNALKPNGAHILPKPYTKIIFQTHTTYLYNYLAALSFGSPNFSPLCDFQMVWVYKNVQTAFKEFNFEMGSKTCFQKLRFPPFPAKWLPSQKRGWLLNCLIFEIPHRQFVSELRFRYFGWFA